MRQLFLLFCLIPLTLFSNEEPRNGTLIVTYQTDHKGERLERIRFWLKSAQKKQSLYPKGSTLVSDPENKTHMVVIDDLVPGSYTVEFVIPNLDGRFEEIPIRELIIAEGDVVKIDQEIKTRKEKWNTPTETIQRITKKETIVPVKKPITKDTPKSIDESVGKLIVSYDLKENLSIAQDIRFRLIGPGGTTVHPAKGKDTEVPLNAGKMVMIQNLLAGPYTIEFYLENSNQEFPKKSFEIQKDRTKSIHQPLRSITQKEEKTLSVAPTIPSEKSIKSLTLSANIPTAEYQLIHLDTLQEYQGKGREYHLSDLESGSYRITYSSTDPFFIPPNPEIIRLKESEPEQKEVLFRTLGKVRINTNVPYTSVSITPMDQGDAAYKKEVIGGEVSLYLPEGRYRVTFKDVRDKKAPDPVDIQVHPLQTEEVNAYFSETSAYPQHHAYVE